MSRSAGATSEPSRVLRSPTVARTLAWSAALGCLLFAPSLLAQTASGTATADDVPGDEETAEDGEVIGASRSQRDLRRPGTPDLSAYRSDQFGAFELRFGPYVPDVDDEIRSCDHASSVAPPSSGGYISTHAMEPVRV